MLLLLLFLLLIKQFKCMHRLSILLVVATSLPKKKRACFAGAEPQPNQQWWYAKLKSMHI